MKKSLKLGLNSFAWSAITLRLLGMWWHLSTQSFEPKTCQGNSCKSLLQIIDTTVAVLEVVEHAMTDGSSLLMCFDRVAGHGAVKTGWTFRFITQRRHGNHRGHDPFIECYYWNTSRTVAVHRKLTVRDDCDWCHKFISNTFSFYIYIYKNPYLLSLWVVLCLLQALVLYQGPGSLIGPAQDLKCSQH